MELPTEIPTPRRTSATESSKRMNGYSPSLPLRRWLYVRFRFVVRNAPSGVHNLVGHPIMVTVFDPFCVKSGPIENSTAVTLQAVSGLVDTGDTGDHDYETINHSEGEENGIGGAGVSSSSSTSSSSNCSGLNGGQSPPHKQPPFKKQKTAHKKLKRLVPWMLCIRVTTFSIRPTLRNRASLFCALDAAFRSLL